MFSFDAPGFLFLLFLLIPGVYFSHFRKKGGSRVAFPISVWPEDGFNPRQKGLRFIITFSSFLLWGGIFFLIISLAGPTITKKERVYISRGIDIMLVLDESPSMAAKDFKPENRFQTAREVIRRFVRGRENDPIGLVSFSKEAALRVPPTLDYNFLLERLNKLKIMSLGDGTAIGMGLVTAVLHLKHSTAEEKVIILLTDGENNAGEILPETAAEIAERMGIRIYTIGIGTKGEVPLEFINTETGKVYRGTFKSGFDEKLLRRIAFISGGNYFSATGTSMLELIFRAIDSIETKARHVKVKTETIPRYRVFLFISIFSIYLHFIIRKWFLREVVF